MTVTISLEAAELAIELLEERLRLIDESGSEIHSGGHVHVRMELQLLELQRAVVDAK